jgi:hypothetical protein
MIEPGVPYGSKGTLREDSSEVVTHLLLRQWNPSIQAFKSIIRGSGATVPDAALCRARGVRFAPLVVMSALVHRFLYHFRQNPYMGLFQHGDAIARDALVRHTGRPPSPTAAYLFNFAVVCL